MISLKSHAFSRRKLNKDWFDLYQQLTPCYEFWFSEMEKIRNLTKSEEEKQKLANDLSAEETKITPKYIEVTSEDFDEDKCSIPTDKRFWLTEEQIQSVLKWNENNKDNK